MGAVRIAPPLFPSSHGRLHQLRLSATLAESWGRRRIFCTEMVSGGFLELDRRYRQLPTAGWGVRDEPRPITVQIWDNDPEKLVAVCGATRRGFCRHDTGRQFRLSRRANH